LKSEHQGKARVVSQSALPKRRGLGGISWGSRERHFQETQKKEGKVWVHVKKKAELQNVLKRRSKRCHRVRAEGGLRGEGVVGYIRGKTVKAKKMEKPRLSRGISRGARGEGEGGGGLRKLNICLVPIGHSVTGKSETPGGEKN